LGKKNTAISLVFAITGLILGVIVLVENPFCLAITLFVSIALFIITGMSLANYKFQVNKNKTLHRIVIVFEAIAALTMLIEISSNSDVNLALYFVIFSAFFLFDLYLGIDVLFYFKKKKSPIGYLD
jgi:hypothetical protein